MSQVDNGKAFEWALALELQQKISSVRPTAILTSAPQAEAEDCYSRVSAKAQTGMLIAANAAVTHICEVLEERLSDPLSKGSGPNIGISIMPDSAGQAGDVRDLVVIEGLDWEIGISAKHNHAALKHPRVPANKSVTESWLGVATSDRWRTAMQPVYAWLEAHKGELWANRSDTYLEVYGPILKAVSAELWSIQEEGNLIAEKLLRYFLGSHDFYKVIYLPSDKKVLIQAFNMSGTLGRNRANKRQNRLGHVPFPKRLGKCHIASNTLFIRMDGGWELSLRIHSADSKIKRSGLKFDVQLVGHPPALYTHYELLRL